MAEKKLSYFERLDAMSFDELKALADKEIEKYENGKEERQHWSIMARRSSMDSFRKKMRRIISRMYKDDPEGFKAAMDKLPAYTMTKTTEEEKLISYCNSLLKAEDSDSRRIYLNHICNEERVRD